MRCRVCLVLVLCAACTRTTSSRATVRPNPAAAREPSGGDDLGPPDADAEAAAEDAAPDTPEFTFVARGPERLYGSRGDRRRRPDIPGRSGALRVAIDTPYQLFGRASSYVHVAAWRPDGRPAAHARVFVGRRSVGRTDRHGTLVFRLDHAEREQDPGPSGAALFVIDAASRCGAVGFAPYGRTPTFASDQLYVYTDRGVYRPGETVHVRAIGWRLQTDYTPIVGADIELFLRDRDQHSIAAGTIHTDDFGAGTVDLAVPISADPGDYELTIAYGQARESTELQIRTFEAPQIRITHDLPRHLARDRETLAFRVTAHPVSGGSLGKGRVEIEATGARGRSVRLARAVEGDGPHAFAFTAAQLARLRDGRPDGAAIDVVVRVRDGHGRQDVVLRSIDVSGNPYVAVLEPDRDAYATGDEVAIVARVSDLDDVALRGRTLALVLAPDGRRLEATTDRAGLATFRFPMPDREQTIALHADDVVRPIATATLPWQTPAPMHTALSDAVVREEAKVAVTARFPRGHEPADRRVHVDVTDTSGAIVGATVLHAVKERGGWVARGELVAPTWGSALLTFFALGRTSASPGPRIGARTPERDPLGLLVAGQELAVVPDRELEVVLEGLPTRAGPGTALEVQARVRDRRGRPVDFAASVALVDSAVLALHDPLEVTPMDRFYDPDLRTLGTTGAQMLTWPVVSRNWGEAAWDVALPPFPFLDGGEIGTCRDFWDDRDHTVFAEVYGAGGLDMSGLGAGGGGTGAGAIGLGTIGTIGRGAGASITVRKRFDDTSAWLPDVRGHGRASVRATLPDTIGEQEIVVVASDRNGGVGVARERIAVDQALVVEADLPDRVIAGEQVEVPVLVHHRGKTAAEADVRLGATRRRVRVPGLGSAGVSLPLPTGTGRRAVALRAELGDRIDAVERTVTFVPAGVPMTEVVHHVPRKPGELAFSIEGSDGRTGHLRVEVPDVTAAMLGLDALLATVADDPWALASDLAAAGVLLRLADRHGLRSAGIVELRGSALAAIAMLGKLQRRSGALAYWRNGRSSPFVTAMVLDGLLEARAAGLRVPGPLVRRAAEFVADRMPSGELAELRDIGWWEGDDALVRTAISSEIFAVLARLPPTDRSPAIARALTAMEKRAAATIADPHVTDVRTLAGATLGLLRLERIDRDEAAAIARRIIALRDHGHWEPTWFSAWGGAIEATAAALELLAITTPGSHGPERRDALQWLLAGRDAWGTWHNERGTVAALRAIAAIEPTAMRRASTIRVAVDGETIARASIDPRDPAGSAAALAHVEIAAAAQPGKHRVTVEVDGDVVPTVTWVGRTWVKGTSAQADQAGRKLHAKAPATLASGERASIAIAIGGRRLGGAIVRIARGALVDVDLSALADEVGRGGPIAEIRPGTEAIELRLAPTARAFELRIPVRAVRRGHGRWPAIALVPLVRGRPGAPLVVDPGPLAIDPTR